MDFKIKEIKEKTLVLINSGTGELLEVHKSEELLAELEHEPETLLKVQYLGNEKPNEKLFWSDSAIYHLIEAYKEKQKLFTSTAVRRDEVWKDVSHILLKDNFKFTANQCRDKFKNLKKVYMKAIDNMGPKSTGESPITFKYFSEMDEIFGSKPITKPVAVASSSRGVTNQKENESSSSSQGCRKRKSDGLIAFLEKKEKQKEEGRDRRHAEKLELQRTALSEFSNIMKTSLKKD